MGNLDKGGRGVKTQIRIANVTGQTPVQIENTFNNNWGNVGWRFVQVIVIGANTYVVVERQV